MQRKEFENRIKNLLPKAADVWLILMLKSSKAAIIVARTAQYGVKIPIKTQGWINSSLLDITVKDGKMSGGHMSGKNQSTVIYKYMNQLIEAVGKDV